MDTPQLTGLALMIASVNEILEHPDSWDQRFFHTTCGTRHCMAGHMQKIATGRCDGLVAEFDATHLGGLTEEEAEYLFGTGRSLYEIWKFVYNLCHPSDFSGGDLEGYDKDGRDTRGCDRYGRNHRGRYPACVASPEVYEPDGYDFYGYDRTGHDREGNRLPFLQ